MLESRGIIKKYNYFETFAWAFMGTFNKYCNAYEPENLNPSFRKFYNRAADMSKNDLILCDAWAKSLLKQQGKLI